MYYNEHRKKQCPENRQRKSTTNWKLLILRMLHFSKVVVQQQYKDHKEIVVIIAFPFKIHYYAHLVQILVYDGDSKSREKNFSVSAWKNNAEINYPSKSICI